MIGSLARELIHNTKEHPDDIENLVDEFEKVLYKRILDNKRMIFIQFIASIYEYDYKSLERDVLKHIVLDTYTCIGISKKERVHMLRVALFAYRRWLGNDYSILLDECYDKIKVQETMEEAGDKLPFV